MTKEEAYIQGYKDFGANKEYEFAHLDDGVYLNWCKGRDQAEKDLNKFKSSVIKDKYKLFIEMVEEAAQENGIKIFEYEDFYKFQDSNGFVIDFKAEKYNGDIAIGIGI